MGKNNMSIITFDIEADGLLRDAARMWCLSMKVDNEPAELFVGDAAISRAHMLLQYIEDGHKLVGHNISGYDIPLLKKLHGIDIDVSKCEDTLLLSQMLEPEEFQHSLESWGEYLGDEKIQHEDWTQYSDEMGIRCKKDCDITKKVYDTLVTQLGSKVGAIPLASLHMEMEFNRIMAEQEVAGWQFDLEAAHKLVVDLDKQIDELSADILSVAPKRVVKNLSNRKPFKAQGKLSAVGEAFIRDNQIACAVVDLCGEFCTFQTEDMNLNSPPQLKEYLLTLGWRPTEFNYKKDSKRIVKDDNGKPIVSSAKLSNLESLTNPVGVKISRRMLLSHRRNQIRGWTERIRPDGRLEAGGQSCACNTARVRHRNIVNVPKASDDVYLGRAMRALFIAKDGYTLVGADLDQLEARVAGHHTYQFDNGEYADLLLSGDQHTMVAQILNCDRAIAKQAGYALMFGAQVPKLASILGCDDKRAGYLWNEWWNLRSSLKDLKEAVTSSIESRGYDRKGRLDSKAYVRTIDGRPIFIRSWHSALNALIQSTGSILFKEIVCRASVLMRGTDIDATLVGNFHDELILETLPKDVDRVKEVLTEACEYVNVKYNLRVPLTMNVRWGKSWGEVH
jgi:DNA polymerase-1